ncbi:MAG: hypothetical protein ACODAQ_02160, partial [Phycisphaeraceae bacterium]
MSRRRKRWLRRLQQWRHQRQEQRRQRAEAAAAVPQPLELETLEPRVLLTTLFGGEIFEYQDAEENTIRVALEGDGLIVELIGGEADEDGTLRLGDLPGRIISSFDPSREGINIGGGLGGEEGVNVIGETPVLDLSPFGLGTFTLTDGPNEAINIEALAGETDEGEMFGFNFGTVDVEGETLPLIQLVRMDANDEDLSFDSDGDGEPDPGSNGDAEGFVNAILSQATLGGDVEQELSGDFDEVFGIDAFSVDPDDPDIAYALSEGQLYKIFREARTENGVEYEAGDVQRVGPVRDQQTDAEEITDTTRFAADLIGFSSDEDGSFYSLFKDDLLYNGLFVNDGDDNAPVQSVNGDLGDNYNFVALAVREIDDAADLTYAVNEAEDGSLDLYQIERDAETGAATDATRIGVLTDVDGNPISGVRSMTFNEEGELFVVGSRPGRAQELFQITPAAEDLDGDEVSDEVRAQHLSLAFSRDGDVNGLAWDADAQQFYGVVRVGGEDGEDRLLQIPATTSAGPADSAVLTDPGDVSDYITGLSSDQLNQFYSIFNRPQMNGALLFNAFDHIPVESVGNDLLADFDVQGLAVVSRPFSVEEPSGANAATALGILAADTDDGTKDGRIEGAAITTEAEPLSTDTTLAELGITPVVGTDLRFVQQDGTVFTVDLSEAETLGQALNEINNATGGDVEARINDTATGLVLIDNSTDNVVESSELVFLTTNDGGDLELRVAQRDSSGALSDLATINLGDLEDSGGNPITDVFAMESDVTGRFYFVGTVGGQRTLFQAVINRSDDGTPTDYEIESEAAVALGGDVMALAMSDRLDRSTLHAVVRNGAQDQLVQFGVDGGGALDGTVDPIGFVQVEDADGTPQDTRIKAMAFDPATGHLVAVDDSLQDDPDADEPDPGVENRRRLVRIVDSDDDGTLDPADSVQQTTPGSVPASLRGYGLDEAGNLYSVADVGVEVDGELVRADQLWTTGNNFSPLAFVNGDLGPNRPFIELTVTPDGEGGDVFAIAPMDDGSGIGLYRIDGAVDGEPGRTAGTGLTFLGEITDGFGAAIDGIFDIESDADGNLLLVGRNIEAPLPVVNVGQTDQLDAPGTDYDDLFALTVTDNERIFAIDNVSGGGFELLELERLAPNRGGLLHDVIELGELRTASNQPLGNVETITTDMDTGKVYIVGSVSGAANAPRQLFEVNIGNGIAINPVDLTDGGAALEQAVSTMAFADGELYLTVPESGGEQLYRVQTDSQGEPTGELEALGEILASDPRNDDPPVQVTLEAMAANSEGELVAVFDDGSARRMLVLSADAPDEARFTTADGGDPDDNLDDVVGLASDPHGLFYSLHNPGTGDNIQLRSNSNTIYRIDPATDALQDLNGDDLAEEVQGTFVNYLTRENPWSGPSQQIPIVNDVTQIAFIDDGGQGDLHAIVHFRGEAVPFTDTRAGSNEGASIINLEQTHGRFDVATGEFHEVAFPNDVTVTLRELLGNVTLEGEDDDEVVVTTPMGDIVGMDANGAEELILVVEVGEDENGDPIREVQRIHLDAHWIIHRDRLFPNDEQDDEFDVEVPATEVEPLTAPSAIDHNLVGFASDGEGDVFYSIYDDGLL